MPFRSNRAVTGIHEDVDFALHEGPEQVVGSVITQRPLPVDRPHAIVSSLETQVALVITTAHSIISRRRTSRGRGMPMESRGRICSSRFEGTRDSAPF